MWRPVVRVIVGLAFCSTLAGCGGGFHPVRGKVVYDDGKPVTGGGRLVFQPEGADGLSAVASYATDGTFEAYTLKPSPPDGVKAGTYLVGAIGHQESPNALSPHVDGKYGDPTTSGIRVEVAAGTNDLTVTVPRPKRGNNKKGGE